MSDQLDRLTTALADRYRLERELGHGGMATVYLAEDLKLERKVAVKVLHPELAATLGPDRFLREIKLSARLEHPHILTLHDSGEADGFLYYVMPYVEGESLRDRLNREKQLPIEDAIRIAGEVADALDYAHRRDVIHRDIKPENILLEEQHAVVGDFGIARAISEAGGDRLTETGIAVGTPAYMSPEQTTGSRELDARSDIYSLGCVVYEMFAGEPPFTGPTVESVVRQHLAADPSSVASKRAAVSEPVGRVVGRALAKAPADRFGTAVQFAEALTAGATAPVTSSPRGVFPAQRWLGLATAAAVVGGAAVAGYVVMSTPQVVPRLVVLPFDNLGDPADEYFADGLTEEITSRLTHISGLTVISRTSAMQYKRHTKTLREIGAALEVSHVLEGTVRTDRSPNGSGQVRVTPQLIRVSDDAHLWADNYTAQLVPGAIFGVQAQVAERVAEALNVTLLESERRALEARPTDNFEAYQYYLRGTDYERRSSSEHDVQLAIQMYENAIERDAGFALAWARLSRVHSKMWFYFYSHTEERLAKAKEAADRAVVLDPGLPEAHLALGYYYYWGFLDYDRALAEFAIVEKAQPNNALLYNGIASAQRRRGNLEEALANYLKEIELDPRRPGDFVGVTYADLGNYVEAERWYDRTIATHPERANAYLDKAWLYLNWGASPEKARLVLEQATRFTGEAGGRTAVLVEVFDGKYQDALDRLSAAPLDAFEGQAYFVPKAQLQAKILGLLNRPRLARAYYDSALAISERQVGAQPDEANYHSALGIALAGLGRKNQAIGEGRLAVDLLPVTKEAIRGLSRIRDLAAIYAMVGEVDEAVEQLELLLSLPGGMWEPALQLDPVWNPLRSDPRFQALLAKYPN
jgi:serine/threonine-protein kinase